MANALQTIPAGAKHVGGNVYQLPRRRGASRAVAKHHKKGMRKSYRHSFFARQWVWYAVAIAMADAVGEVIFANVAPWVSVPALMLYAYGTWKNKPGAKNAALAIQGAHMLVYWGVTGVVRDLVKKNFGGGASGS